MATNEQNKPIPNPFDPKDSKPVMTKSRGAMSGWPMVIFFIAMILFACHASTHMVGAGDTWVALACGRHFVNHGVNTVEPFSANSHTAGPTDADLKDTAVWPKWVTENFSPSTIRYWHPTGWINQNWLTHVIFYELVEKFGKPGDPAYNALVVWKFAIYIIAVFVVYATGRYLGVNPVLSAVFACFAMFVGRTFLDIRPAGFSNLFVGINILIFVLTMYRSAWYIWLIVPLVVAWCNLHGGYLYAFIVLVPFIGMNLLMSVPKKWYWLVYGAGALAIVIGGVMAGIFAVDVAVLLFVGLAILSGVFYYLRGKTVTIGMRGVIHSIAAAVVAFIGMIVFNPFHLTNLTHTYVISFSKHAELWREINEWHSAWEFENPVGDSYPFLYMFIIAIIVAVLWTLVWLIGRPAVNGGVKGKAAPQLLTPSGTEFVWPKIDITLIIIGALTLYMAVRSRRFIPIAAIAAAPIIAMLLDQLIKMIAAKIHSPGRSRLYLPGMPAQLQKAIVTAGALAVVGLGSWWGYNYYKIYLAPWPDDDQYTSVFMRMTASYAKPFCAGAFIRENKLSGQMYNYWTEGGFIAWIQTPDPNTGRTPLQLFMDGRAQAAYEPAMYDLWKLIMAGGPAAMSQNPDYKQVGKWLDGEFKKRGVWIVLMPSAQFDTPLIQGLERNPDWRTVFLNNKQQILVDIKTQQGKDIFMGVIGNSAWFPDVFSRSLSRAHLLMQVNNEDMQASGVEEAIKSFKLKPSQMPLVELFGVARDPKFKAQVDKLTRDYLADFDKNKEKYENEDGFNNKIVAAIVAANYVDKTSDNAGEVEDATAKLNTYRAMQRDIMDVCRW